ncbi:hypothetical protein ACP4OV_031221 [Aristida adscensionis]
MELGIEAARWVVGKALGSASGRVLEAWAASAELGPNIRDVASHATNILALI